MSAISVKDLPPVSGTKTYTVSGGKARGIGFFCGMFFGQLGAFFGCFFGAGKKNSDGNWMPAWWALCFLGNAFQGFQGLFNATWWPAKLERTADYFIAVSVCGQRAKIPLSWLESISVGETSDCCPSQKYKCIVFTLTEEGARNWGCGCVSCLRCTCIKYGIDEWDQFLADNGLSASAQGYGKSSP
mmetsp:Transcript_17995/g.52449  ORF Transcript_17995/g.52449 Transcript_17995/m.52449 type:complete len:186 (+) Transcript_17995:63-620(+)